MNERQVPAGTRRLLWLAMAVFAPVGYALVVVVLASSTYEAPGETSSPVRWILLAAGVLAFIALYISRDRLSLASSGGLIVLPWAMAEGIAVLGLVVYLLFGGVAEALALVAAALMAGLRLRPAAQ